MTSISEDLRAAAQKCTRCGSCLVVCPVSHQLGAEASTARGKLYLIRALAEGRLNPAVDIAAVFNTCLLCESCAERCPSGVRTNDLFLRLRNELSTAVPLPLAKRVAFTCRTYRRAFDALMGMGPLVQKILFKPAAHGEGCEARFPLPAAGLAQRRVVPRMSRTTLRSLLPSQNGLTAPTARVAFFPGCMLSYVYPEAGAAVVRALNAHNIRVDVPDTMGCCGTPMMAAGDFRNASLLAERTIMTLSGGAYDAIITACATCGSALTHTYELLPLSPAVRDAWDGLRGKVRDFADYMAVRETVGQMRPQQLTVTYHDPCHLAKGMGVRAQPRALLRSLPGVVLREMREPAACCGCGGTFSLDHYALSKRINDMKVEQILETGADAVASGCPACLMHLADGLARHGSDMRVVHTAQIVAAAYGG